MLILVRSFSYTRDASFISFLIHSSCCFSLERNFSCTPPAQSVVLVRSFSYPADASFSSVRSALGTPDANILMRSFTFTPRALWF